MPASSLTSFITGAAAPTVAIRSQLTPDVVVDLATGAQAPSEPSAASLVGDWLMSLVKPSVEISAFGAVHVVEPWGTPTKSYGCVAIAATGILLLSAVGAYTLIKNR
jgi:hypothetical protein